MTDESKAPEAEAPVASQAVEEKAGAAETPAQLPITAVKAVLNAVLDGVDLTKLVLADGKISFADGVTVIEDLPKLAADISDIVGQKDQIIPQAKDLSGEEIAELGAMVIARELATGHDHAAKIVAAGLKLAAHLVADTVELVAAIRG